ncbi:MAG: thioredoxin TrxC [Burkholderiales bacterium]|nr:thioredoxin TrxC [Burkholderiales bacterium]
MSEFNLIVCPNCEAINRTPLSRMAELPKCGKCKAPLFDGHPIALRSGSFDRHIRHNTIPVVVDFWAAWCGPCKMMAPLFEKAAMELEPSVRLAKLDTEAESSIAAQYNIRSIPTFAIFRGGREIARQAGAMDYAELARWIGTNAFQR